LAPIGRSGKPSATPSARSMNSRPDLSGQHTNPCAARDSGAWFVVSDRLCGLSGPAEQGQRRLRQHRCPVLQNPQVKTGVRLSSLRERAPDRRRALSAVGGRHGDAAVMTTPSTEDDQ
jgi:hypothetical protein